MLNKGLVQLFIVALLASGIPADPLGSGLGDWPLWAQVAFGLVASEFGRYWAHRLAHEWPWLWRFHAIHHSVQRLWLVNTGRFHFVDSFTSVLFSLPFLLLSGISMEAVIWVSAVTAYLGILTHCNVDMHCGRLSLLFNTPELHRWHHAIDPAIGNRNYGETLMLWDPLFGTFSQRRGAASKPSDPRLHAARLPRPARPAVPLDARSGRGTHRFRHVNDRTTLHPPPRQAAAPVGDTRAGARADGEGYHVHGRAHVAFAVERTDDGLVSPGARRALVDRRGHHAWGEGCAVPGASEFVVAGLATRSSAIRVARQPASGSGDSAQRNRR